MHDVTKVIFASVELGAWSLLDRHGSSQLSTKALLTLVSAVRVTMAYTEIQPGTADKGIQFLAHAKAWRGLLLPMAK